VLEGSCSRQLKRLPEFFDKSIRVESIQEVDVTGRSAKNYGY
jgi:hypothetical protein